MEDACTSQPTSWIHIVDLIQLVAEPFLPDQSLDKV
jgi:hypothetical protein